MSRDRITGYSVEMSNTSQCTEFKQIIGVNYLLTIIRLTL